MGTFITEADLAPFATIDAAKAAAMIEDAEAQAILTAPCITGLTTAPADETSEQRAQRLAKLAAVKSILRAAILRWNDTGSGAVQQTQVGPFGQMIDTRQHRKGMFWPSEIESLQGICSSGEQGKAFAVDTVAGIAVIHAPWCALNMGANYCSCGADIAGYPIYEVP